LSDAESKAFWPVYKEYEADLEKLGDRRINLIRELANALKDMSQEKAAELMEESLDIESDRIDLWEKYYDKFKDKLMAFRAAQIIMFEREVQTLIDLQIYSNMPTIELKKK
jgi:methanogenic corrinoid protein MtbC1